MKTTVIYLAILLWLLAPCGATSDSTDSLSVCREIGVSLTLEYLKQGRSLPDSLNRLEGFREYRRGDLWALRIANSMAVVPGAPVIRLEQGISRDRVGPKLFAIGRYESFDYGDPADKGVSGRGGRHSIWIAEDGITAITNWIPEPEVRLILDQVGNFEPAAQPLPFPDVAKMERKKMDSQSDELALKEGYLRPTIGVKIRHAFDQHPAAWIAGVAAVLMLIIGSVWNIARIRKRNKSVKAGSAADR